MHAHMFVTSCIVASQGLHDAGYHGAGATPADSDSSFLKLSESGGPLATTRLTAEALSQTLYILFVAPTQTDSRKVEIVASFAKDEAYLFFTRLPCQSWLADSCDQCTQSITHT